MDETTTEILTLLVLLLANVLAGALPILVVKKCFSGENPDHSCQKIRALAFFLHFGMGAFMSLCLVVLLPQCRDLFEIHEHSHVEGKILIEECPQDDHHHESFPIPEFVILCGFFATFALQELLHYCIYHCRRKDPAAHPRVRFCSCAKRHTECSRTFKADNPVEQTLFGLEKRRNTDAGIPEENSALYSATDQVPELPSNLLRSSILSQPIPNYGSVATLTDAQPETPVLITANNGTVTLIQRPHSPVQDKNILTSNILLVITLSYSALYGGVRMGRAFQSSSWEKLIADSLQMVTATFVIGCVGVSQSESVTSAVSYVAVLSVMSPLGMGLDMLLGQKLQDLSGCLWGVAEALVCGSLLYLTFCDVLRRSQMKEFPHVVRFAAFTSGAALIALLQYVSVTF